MASKDRGGLSKKEWEKKYGKKWEGESSSSSLSKIVKNVLGVSIDKNEKVLPTFEEIYTGSEKEKSDTELAKSDMVPYYEEKIMLSMEDLNDFVANQNVNYQRSLRTARASLAKMGGAIGSERTGREAEIKRDKDAQLAEQTKAVEKQVGSEKIKAAGFTSAFEDIGKTLKGSLNEDLEGAIEEQKLYYREQSLNKYNSDVAKIYSQYNKTI